MYGWSLRLAWDGSAYVGWQVQPNGPSIQAACEAALAELLGGERVRLRAAGRTDAGVHALDQVVGMRCHTLRDADALVRGLNALLPPDIACLSAERAPDDFEPRAWVERKTYRYRILSRQAHCPFRARFAWHRRRELDLTAMQEGAVHLVGRHDFSSFRAQGCSAAHPNRVIESVRVLAHEDEIWMEFLGNAFLRHQVRIMVGTLVDVGQDRIGPDELRRIVVARDRSAAGATAPAHGLVLVGVELADTPRTRSRKA
jgi:tRNA pseudouridine38-40 synthase